MSRPTLNITVYRGRTGNVPVVLSIDGAPIDITGAAVKCHVRDRLGGTLFQELTVGSGVTLTDAVNGALTLEFLLQNVGEYVFDAFIENTSFDEGRPFVGGAITVLDSVTEP